MCEVLRVDPGECSANARNSATLPLALGGVGLRSAVRTSGSASWASWADALAMIKQRHPEVSHRIIGELEGNPTTPNLWSLAPECRRVCAHRPETPKSTNLELSVMVGSMRPQFGKSGTPGASS